jgi:ketosteroid isomerase-like protein
MSQSLQMPSRRRSLRAGGLLLAAPFASSVAGFPAMASGAGPVADRDAIDQALARSAASWNRNDLTGFMAIYEDSPTTSYLKGATVVRGFEAIRSLYATRFGKGANGMGTLSTEALDFRMLGASYALCIGRFSLRPPGGTGTPATGMFSLVFHRGPTGWKIVSDHTGS